MHRHIQIFDPCDVILLNAGHASDLLMRGLRRLRHLARVLLMLLEDLAFCLKVSLPHFRDVADLYIRVFYVSKKDGDKFLAHVATLQPLADIIPLLNLYNLHLVEKFSDLSLGEIDTEEELVLLLQLILQLQT